MGSDSNDAVLRRLDRRLPIVADYLPVVDSLESVGLALFDDLLFAATEPVTVVD